MSITTDERLMACAREIVKAAGGDAVDIAVLHHSLPNQDLSDGHFWLVGDRCGRHFLIVPDATDGGRAVTPAWCLHQAQHFETLAAEMRRMASIISRVQPTAPRDACPPEAHGASTALAASKRPHGRECSEPPATPMDAASTNPRATVPLPKENWFPSELVAPNVDASSPAPPKQEEDPTAYWRMAYCRECSDHLALGMERCSCGACTLVWDQTNVTGLWGGPVVYTGVGLAAWRRDAPPTIIGTRIVVRLPAVDGYRTRPQGPAVRQVEHAVSAIRDDLGWRVSEGTYIGDPDYGWAPAGR